MPVKYIIHYVKNSETPNILVWSGKESVPQYAVNHDINIQNIALFGHLVFNGTTQLWEFGKKERLYPHFQFSKKELAQFQKKMNELPLLKNSTLQRECLKISFFRRIFQHD